jgi:5-epi-alpha-selinene synthase
MYISFIKKVLSASPKLHAKIPHGLETAEKYRFNLGEIDGIEISGDLYCPIKPRSNPHYDSVKKEILDWAEQCGLFSKESDKVKFSKADFTLLGAWCYPDLDREGLLLSVKWLTFLFYHDDRFDNKQSKQGEDIEAMLKTNSDLLSILKGNDLSDRMKTDPLAVIAKEIADEIKLRSYEAEFFIERVHQYFDATVMEARLRLTKQKQTVEQFLPIRQYVGAVYTTFEMGLIAADIQLTKTVRGELQLIEIARHANNCVCEANDIFSLRKEMEEGSTNLITIKHETDGLSWEDSTLYVSNLHNCDVEKILEIKKGIIDNLMRINNVKRYIEIMEYWVIGNIKWSQGTGRYNKK